ncbi:Hypothetical predicted protein [Pelobates cultripes]|uniref:Uncharacterized protein n=1 Tax=Pelobates cultripes TaxID=61616 RepID=A0AAD1WT80_PELCU|nr:Hypothetical predicted protein [Pelobates cultripes]
MADDTRLQTSRGEMSDTHRRLEAIFDAFWRKLESRLTPTETTEAPPETSHCSSKCPAAHTMSPTNRRQRRRPRRCMAVNTAGLQARKPYTSSTMQNDTHGVGERSGKRLMHVNMQRSPLAESLRNQAIWDTKIPTMGIG